jgi:IS30 family transposase
LLPEERLEILLRRQAGEPWKSIQKVVGVSHQTVSRVLKRFGGVPPRWTTCNPTNLSFEDREEISRQLVAKATFRAIATGLGRAVSTISREVAANGGRLAYRAVAAHRRAWDRARRPKPCKLASNPRLAAVVAGELTEYWSPQEISGRLKRDFPDDEEMRVSHETIYQTLFVQTRGGLRKELTAYLRTGREHRKPRPQVSGERRGKLLNMVNISERPAEVEDRAVPGHWEGDLIIGAHGRSAVGTLVERATRYVLLLRLPGRHDAETVRKAMTTKILTLPASLRRTLTWDQGKEMADHVQFSIDTGVVVYFCDPHSPWQRGSNENTNGLLRQFMPKGTDLSIHSEADLDRFADLLNGRPRQTLNWMKPSEAFNELVAQTA